MWLIYFYNISKLHLISILNYWSLSLLFNYLLNSLDSNILQRLNIHLKNLNFLIFLLFFYLIIIYQCWVKMAVYWYILMHFTLYWYTSLAIIFPNITYLNMFLMRYHIIMMLLLYCYFQNSLICLNLHKIYHLISFLNEVSSHSYLLFVVEIQYFYLNFVIINNLICF